MAATINMALPKVAKNVLMPRSCAILPVILQKIDTHRFGVQRMYSLPSDVDKWRKFNWKDFQTGRQRVETAGDDEFTRYVIPGHENCKDIIREATMNTKQRRRRIRKDTTAPPRSLTMSTDQDWTAVWPAAHTFKWSVVPFPVRQGVVRPAENEGIPPSKYANAELIKIPNFLHLTPVHVKKHCAAIKHFCTEWPRGLETDEQCDKHFPVDVATEDYLADGPSIRDPRARVVTLKIPLAVLDLDQHARDKMLLLVGDRYDPSTGMLTLKSDRCPTKAQNTDYLVYLLTALYHESWKVESWENDMTQEDMLTYNWDLTAARNNIHRVVKQIKEIEASSPEPRRVPEDLKQLPTAPSEAAIDEALPVRELKEALRAIHRDGEDVHSLNKYKEAAKKLLLGTAMG